MRILKVDMSEGNNTILVWGDWHIGKIGVDYKAIERFIRRLKREKRTRWIHMGDYIEAIYPHDPRFNVLEHGKKNVVASKEEFIRLVDDVAGWQLITILKGNHEEKIERLMGEMHKEVCERLDTMVGDTAVGIELYFPNGVKKKMFLIHGRHTYRMNSGFVERDEVNKKIKMRKMFSKFSGDILGQGHAHDLFVVEPVKDEMLDFDERGLHFKEREVDNRWYFCSGTALKGYPLGYTSYEELYHYAPYRIGYIEIVFTEDGEVKHVKPIEFEEVEKNAGNNSADNN